MAPDIRLLVVCTANVARSPLLEVRLQADLDRALGPGTACVESAGTTALYGQSAAAGSLQVAERWGLSLATHQSRSLAYVDPSVIDLVLVMTKRHDRAVTRSLPFPAERTFRVRPLVALADSIAATAGPGTPGGPSVGSPGGPSQRLDSLLTAAADRRTPGPVVRRLDIPDPINAPQAVFDALGEEFVAASARICQLLSGAPPPRR